MLFVLSLQPYADITKASFPAYSGPFQVVDWKPKYFTVVIKGKQDIVSIDRLKAAYLDLPIKNSTMKCPVP